MIGLRLSAGCLFGIWLTSVLSAAEVEWKRIKLDETFRSEGACAGDVNHDGKLDVLTGDVWYEAPDWNMHEIRKPGTYDGAKGYSNSFACFARDINADGWVDLICVGFPGVPCHWYENPHGEDKHWAQHEIWHSAANESPQFRDVTGDGVPELIMASEPEGMVGYLEIPAPDKANEKWHFTAVSEQRIPVGSHRYYHGLGAGDVNSDGRQDVLIPHGWWEAPAERTASPWPFHAWTLSKDGKGQPLPAADMYADDLDLDGDADILMSSAHGIGIWWFENTGDKESPFTCHVIDDTYSQTHALHYVDINGDGTKDLVTGKRFWAHGPGGDPDPGGEVVVFWYEIQKTKGEPPKFTRHKIEEGIGTGIGTQFDVADVDGNGKPDLVLANKKGVNLLLQK